MSDSPQALVVDFGGVLTTSVVESFAAFCRSHGIEPEVLKRILSLEGANSTDHPLHLVETGQWEVTDFNDHLSRGLSEGLEEPIDANGLKERLFAEVRPEPAMVMAVKKVRDSGFSTALLSNSWGADGYPRETFADLFDVVVLSGEVGLRKPHADIYRLTAERLAIPIEACVFVDDLKVNVEGAEAAGMRAIHHRDPSDTVAEIERLFGITVFA